MEGKDVVIAGVQTVDFPCGQKRKKKRKSATEQKSKFDAQQEFCLTAKAKT